MKKYVPVLEPDLDDAHVEAGVLAELFSYMSGRFGAVIVGQLERFQLLGSDRGPRPLVRLVSVQTSAL